MQQANAQAAEAVREYLAQETRDMTAASADRASADYIAAFNAWAASPTPETKAARDEAFRISCEMTDAYLSAYPLPVDPAEEANLQAMMDMAQ